MRRAVPFLLLFASLAACREDPRASLLAGRWTCASQAADYRLERDLRFDEDGGLSGRATLSSTDGGTPVAMQLSFSGRWNLSGDRLVEELETQRLMRFARDGQNVPLGELPPGFLPGVESALASRATAFRIVTVSAREMRLEDTGAGGFLDCARATKRP